MKIGIFGGGFKPFTTGHFSKLALAMRENDFVVLFYGISGRKKGDSGYNYTTEIANKIFDITKSAIEREYPKVRVIKGVPTPIVMTFEAIQQFAGVLQNPKFFRWEDLGINPSSSSGDSLTVYVGEDDAGSFLSYVNDPIKGPAYYGDTYKDGSLKFETGVRDGSDIALIGAIEEYLPGISGDEVGTRIRVRGTQVRNAISQRDKAEIFRFLPNFYTAAEKDEIANILFSGLNESLLRNAIRSMILVG